MHAASSPPAPALSVLRPAGMRGEIVATLRLAGPLVLSNLLQMAVFATDVIFLARLGQRDLAASSLGVAVVMILMMAIIGVTSAVAPLIAAELGRRAHAVREVRRSARMGLWVAGVMGLFAVIVCQGGESLLRLTGQPDELAARAGGFIALLSLSLPMMGVAQVLRTVVAALGRPHYAMLVTGLAILINAAGNYVFIFGHLGLPALGLKGSALASIVTSVASVAAYAVAIRKDRVLRRFHLFGRFWRGEPERLRQILALGLPIALTLMAEGGLFSGAAFLMGRIGELSLAAHAIALQIASIAFQVPYGVGQAATIRVGYHYGARDRAALGRAGTAALLAGLAFSALATAAMFAFPRLFLSAYVDVTDPANQALVALATGFLFMAAVFQLSDGLQAIAAGALRGLQDTRVPMAIALGGYWLGGFVTAWFLGLHTDLAGFGVWIGLAVGLALAAVLLMIRWIGRARYGLLPGAMEAIPA